MISILSQLTCLYMAKTSENVVTVNNLSFVAGDFFNFSDLFR